MKEDFSHLIIHSPDLQTIRQKLSSSTLTFLFWGIWLYLWQPIISIIAWGLGIEFFYDNMISLGGIDGFLKLLMQYVVVVLLIALVFFSWAFYNNRKYKRKKRRGKQWKISLHNAAATYRISNEQVLRAKASRRIVVHFNPDGSIRDIE